MGFMKLPRKKEYPPTPKLQGVRRHYIEYPGSPKQLGEAGQAVLGRPESGDGLLSCAYARIGIEESFTVTRFPAFLGFRYPLSNEVGWT